jgi:hypothetical protein
VRTGIRLIDEDFASPTVANGVVYVGSENATLYAFNALSGALLWDAAALPIQSSPTVNGMVYLMHALRDADPYRDRQAERHTDQNRHVHLFAVAYADEDPEPHTHGASHTA